MSRPAKPHLLLVETDPRYTADMLPDWERNFGLPDPCVPITLSIPERRVALVNRMTTEGGQSVAFFTALAATLGYTVTIKEFRPFQFGLSSFGGSRGEIQGPQVRFYWQVSVAGPRLTLFSFGSSSFGRDSFLEIRRADRPPMRPHAMEARPHDPPLRLPRGVALADPLSAEPLDGRRRPRLSCPGPTASRAPGPRARFRPTSCA